MNTFLLIIHGLVGVALLGAITHQSVSLVRLRTARGGRSADSFTARYARVNPAAFSRAIVMLYLAGVVLGAVIYPYYRLNVRTAFEDMQLAGTIGLFELKEHFAAIGLGMLPFYAYLWRNDSAHRLRGNRLAVTLLFAFVVWWDFLIGHVLNNIRGFE